MCFSTLCLLLFPGYVSPITSFDNLFKYHNSIIFDDSSICCVSQVMTMRDLSNEEKEMAMHEVLKSADEATCRRINDLEEQLKLERVQNSELKLQFDELQISMESADVNYEMLKQKCMAQFQAFQDEIQLLKMNRKNTDDEEACSRVPPFQHNQLKMLSSTVEENSQALNDVDLRLQIHENTKYNGRILWKIDDFHTRHQETLAGNLSALHSAPCFTREYGYKFCLRAYLVGDGFGRGTHLSLFVVIMKSDHDSILEWPFQKKVKFTLINQQNRKNDHTEKMVADKDSQSFQRPKQEMNIASGCPLFISLDRLDAEGYLKEDALFFDVTVE